MRSTCNTSSQFMALKENSSLAPLKTKKRSNSMTSLLFHIFFLFIKTCHLRYPQCNLTSDSSVRDGCVTLIAVNTASSSSRDEERGHRGHPHKLHTPDFFHFQTQLELTLHKGFIHLFYICSSPPCKQTLMCRWSSPLPL